MSIDYKWTWQSIWRTRHSTLTLHLMKQPQIKPSTGSQQDHWHTQFSRAEKQPVLHSQTGSGKTHTMGRGLSGKAQNASWGIREMACQDIFLLKNQPHYQNLGLKSPWHSVLNKKARLCVLEGGKRRVQVLALQEHVVNCAGNILKVIDIGSACRTAGQTFATSNSSCSHTCFQMLLQAKGRVHGQFSLVDLIGNEQGAETSSADQQTHMEGTEINRSAFTPSEPSGPWDRTRLTLFRESRPTRATGLLYLGELKDLYDCPDLPRHKCLWMYLKHNQTCRQGQGAEPPTVGPVGSSQLKWKQETETSSHRSLITGKLPKRKKRNCLPRCPAFKKPSLRSRGWRTGPWRSLWRLYSRARLPWALRDDCAARLRPAGLCARGGVYPGPVAQALLSPARCHHGLAPGHAAGRVSLQTSSSKWPQWQLQIKMFGFTLKKEISV